MTISYPNTGLAVLSVTESSGQNVMETVEDLVSSGVLFIVLDLAAVGFCSSLDIAQVISARRFVTESGGQLRLANLNPSVANIYRILKLERLFDFGLDLDQAIAELAAKQL